MANTYRRALSMVGVTVPEHLAADAEVPLLTGAQAQGDLLVLPVRPAAVGDDDLGWVPLTGAGRQVIHGEATGNTHWLHAGFGSGGVTTSALGETGRAWRFGLEPDTFLLALRVPAGQSALLVHTDEHGANGIGPGTYAICRKREHDGRRGSRDVED